MMSLLLFFTKLNRHKQAPPEKKPARHSLPRTKDRSNLPNNAGEYDPAVAHDRSYEDALLDLEIRNFMQSEFGQIEPPHGIFQRVMRAINRSKSTSKAGNTNLLEAFLVGLYNAMRSPVTSRLIPGAVALAVVMAALGANNVQMLQDGTTGSRLYDPPFTSSAPPLQVTSDATAKPETNLNSINGLVLPIKDEAQFLDRVELHLPPKHQDTNDKTTREPAFVPQDRSRSGIQ